MNIFTVTLRPDTVTHTEIYYLIGFSGTPSTGLSSARGGLRITQTRGDSSGRWRGGRGHTVMPLCGQVMILNNLFTPLNNLLMHINNLLMTSWTGDDSKQPINAYKQPISASKQHINASKQPINAVMWTGDDSGSYDYIRWQLPTFVGTGMSAQVRLIL